MTTGEKTRDHGAPNAAAADTATGSGHITVPMPDRPIFLIGFMGAGKTTLGEALHRATGIPFVDLDKAIEARMGMTVRQIFDSLGESRFRQLEREALADSAAPPGLVACGGGTPCQHGNMELMNSLGVTVWLRADHDVLVRRLRLAADNRPLIAALNDDELAMFVDETLRMRTPNYACAMHTFDSSRLETEAQIDAAVRNFILRFLAVPDAGHNIHTTNQSPST